MQNVVFGNSYVSRLERYVRRHPELRHGYKFFGIPGMSITRKFKDIFEKLLEAKPKKVFIILGGNDITDHCRINDIVENLVNTRQMILKGGAESVVICSILEMGSFRGNMDHTRYNKIRRGVNRKLRIGLGKNFVDVCKKVKYPQHFCADLVHPGEKEGGLRILFFNIHRFFGEMQ